MRRLLSAVSIVIGLAQGALAAPVLDVFVDQKDPGYWSPLGVGQSFEVNTTGTLTQIDIEIYSESNLEDLTLSLREFDSVAGPGALLEASPLTDLDTETQPPGTWFSFPFSTPVTAGQDLFIRIPSVVLQGLVGQNAVNVYWTSGGDLYFDGSAWRVSIQTFDWVEDAATDLSLRVYIEPGTDTSTTGTGGTPVPEPASLLMLGAGLVGLATRLRYRG